MANQNDGFVVLSPTVSIVMVTVVILQRATVKSANIIAHEKGLKHTWHVFVERVRELGKVTVNEGPQRLGLCLYLGRGFGIIHLGVVCIKMWKKGKIVKQSQSLLFNLTSLVNLSFSLSKRKVPKRQLCRCCAMKSSR